MKDLCLRFKASLTKENVTRFIFTISLTIFVLFPVIFLFTKLNLKDLKYIFKDEYFYKSIGNSFLYSFISALLAVVLSTICAYLLSRIKFKHKKTLVLLLTIPMLIPTLSVGLGIRTLFGTNGFLDKLLHIEIEATGMHSLILGSFIVAFPVSFLIIYNALQYEDKTVYDASETLGISRLRSFFGITLPYLKVPLISAFFASFTMIFADYGVPMEVAGKINTLPMYLYKQVLGNYNYGRGAIISMVLILPAIVSFVFDLLFKEQTSGEAKKQLLSPSKIFNRVGLGVLIFVIVMVAIPQLSFIIVAFTKSFPNDMTFTFENLISVFNNNAGLGVMSYFRNSLLMALFTGVLGTIIAFICAYYTTRAEGRFSKAMNIISMATLAIPGLVLGIGYVFLFVFTSGWFYRTMLILVAVNIIHFFASPYIMAKNALSKIDKNYETVGSTLGISKPSIFVKVIVPNTISTMVEMFSYFFINSMITISAVAFLCTSFNQPLSILITTYEKQGSYAMQAVISFILLVFNLIMKLILNVVIDYLNKRKNTESEVLTMTLNRYQFDFLTYLEKMGPDKYTQRYLSDTLTISLGLINKMIREYLEENIISVAADKTISITENGLKLLEPYKVKKAIVIAAGFGSRMAPVTIDTPKPLVDVNGVRIIDTLLDALLAAGIDNIYIVRGYKKEKFDQLLDKYPMIKFIDNPLYNESNNISSVYVAKDVIDRCYICEADLIISNPDIITKYQYSTNYLGALVKETDDWCFETSSEIITKVSIGGEDCHQMVGISYWDENDSRKLREDVEKVYNSKGGKENYWDNVPLKICKKNYRIKVRNCSKSDVTEIDNYSELVMIDPKYENYHYEGDTNK